MWACMTLQTKFPQLCIRLRRDLGPQAGKTVEHFICAISHDDENECGKGCIVLLISLYSRPRHLVGYGRP